MVARSVRNVFIVAALLAVALGSGCSLTDKRDIRRVAYAAVKADPNLPAGAKLYPMNKCTVYDAKNAATVEVPFEVAGPGGQTATRSYTVWVKRIAIRWEFDGLRQNAHVTTPQQKP